MEIRKYTKEDEVFLFKLLEEEDNGFGVYIYDLLVRKLYRGGQIGKALIEQFQHDFPEQSIYIMSDVDIYYEKLGYRRIGSVFQV